MALEIVPSIDLRDGHVVRLQQGDYARQINYAHDPIQTARSFAEAGATWMHIVDLDGAKAGTPKQTDLIAKIIAGADIQVEVGGGVRSEDDVKRLLDAGAKRVVIGTRAMEDWSWFSKLAHHPDMADKIVLALDAREGIVATHAWQDTAGRTATGVAASVDGWPLAAILYTDVAKDGMLQGPNLHHTRLLAEAGGVPVIASGGVGSIEHIRAVKELKVWGVIVGRSLYEGAVDLKEAIAVARAG